MAQTLPHVNVSSLHMLAELHMGRFRAAHGETESCELGDSELRMGDMLRSSKQLDGLYTLFVVAAFYPS